MIASGGRSIKETKGAAGWNIVISEKQTRKFLLWAWAAWGCPTSIMDGKRTMRKASQPSAALALGVNLLDTGDSMEWGTMKS